MVRSACIKLMIVVTLVSFCFSVINAQPKSCPTIPNGIVNVSNLELGVRNGSVIVEIGNPYISGFQTEILWDLFSGQLEVTANEKELEALRLIDRLGIESSFFAENTTSYLSLSTFDQSTYALFISGTPKTVFAVNTLTLEQQELGQLTDNASDLSILWYGVDRAIIVVDPIYGYGFGLYAVSIDESSFTDLTLILGYLPERPDLNINDNLLAVYSTGLSRISFLDLANMSVTQEFSITNQLLQNTNPIWSVDGQLIYFWGFDDNLTDYVVYKLDLETGETELVVAVDSKTDINHWVIIPDERILIWWDRDIHIECYD